MWIEDEKQRTHRDAAENGDDDSGGRRRLVWGPRRSRALVLGAAGALAGPSPSALQAPGAIPACAGCNVVLVSKDPAAAEYTTVEEALAYIATQTHDADHPWLVYVAPGVYELEAPLQMLE